MTNINKHQLVSNPLANDFDLSRVTCVVNGRKITTENIHNLVPCEDVSPKTVHAIRRRFGIKTKSPSTQDPK